MKRISFLMLLPLLCAVGCDKSDSASGDGDSATVSAIQVEVSDIEENCATIRVSMTSGSSTRGKLVENLLLSDVQFDYENEIQLVKYVRENGKDITLPYSVKLEDLKNGTQFITAVIALDGNGSATCSDYEIWTAVGKEEAWSEAGNAGDLGEVTW